MGHAVSIATTASRQTASAPRKRQSKADEAKLRSFSLQEKKLLKESLARKRSRPRSSLATSDHIAKTDAEHLLQKFVERSPLSMTALRSQLIPDSTWKRSEKMLAPAASQTIARLAHTLRFATRTWQTEADAVDWLLSPHSELAGATPFSRLRTEAGGREVEYIMAALEYGFSL